MWSLLIKVPYHCTPLKTRPLVGRVVRGTPHIRLGGYCIFKYLPVCIEQYCHYSIKLIINAVRPINTMLIHIFISQSRNFGRLGCTFNLYEAVSCFRQFGEQIIHLSQKYSRVSSKLGMLCVFFRKCLRHRKKIWLK